MRFFGSGWPLLKVQTWAPWIFTKGGLQRDCWSHQRKSKTIPELKMSVGKYKSQILRDFLLWVTDNFIDRVKILILKIYRKKPLNVAYMFQLIISFANLTFRKLFRDIFKTEILEFKNWHLNKTPCLLFWAIWKIITRHLITYQNRCY